MKLEVCQRALVSRLALPNDSRLGAARAAQMAIEAAFRDVELCPQKELGSRRLPMAELGPRSSPHEFARLFSPEGRRIFKRLSVESLEAANDETFERVANAPKGSNFLSSLSLDSM